MKKFAAGILNSLLPPEDSAGEDVEEIDTGLRKVKNPSFAAVAIGDTTCFHNQSLRNVSLNRDQVHRCSSIHPRRRMPVRCLS